MDNHLKDLKIPILRAFTALDENPDKRASDNIRALIDNVRHFLMAPDQQLGMWESHELNYADHALDAGFPKLALISAGKALALHQLPSQEYAFGLKAILDHPGRRNRITARALGEEAAEALAAEQRQAAATLEEVEESAARKLELIEESAAATLSESQREAATALTREDAEAAEALIKVQTLSLARLESEDLERRIYQQGLEQTLAWMSGGYSIGMPKHLITENPFAFMNDEQKTVAEALSSRHGKSASDLKKKQVGKALALKDSDKLQAAHLKEEQRQKALRLSVGQAKQASQKKVMDETDAEEPS